jgi:predicted small secreted protein
MRDVLNVQVTHRQQLGAMPKKAVPHLLRLLANNQLYLNTNMSTFIKRIVVLLFVTTLLAITGVGCNTAHGFGKDMENAGDSIQNGTK